MSQMKITKGIQRVFDKVWRDTINTATRTLYVRLLHEGNELVIYQTSASFKRACNDKWYQIKWSFLPGEGTINNLIISDPDIEVDVLTLLETFPPKEQSSKQLLHLERLSDHF